MAGGIYEQSEWPDSRSDYVQVCDGCHTANLAAPAQTQTPRNGHNAGNGWTGSFPSPCFLLSATENPSVGSIPTSGTA